MPRHGRKGASLRARRRLQQRAQTTTAASLACAKQPICDHLIGMVVLDEVQCGSIVLLGHHVKLQEPRRSPSQESSPTPLCNGFAWNRVRASSRGDRARRLEPSRLKRGCVAQATHMVQLHAEALLAGVNTSETASGKEDMQEFTRSGPCKPAAATLGIFQQPLRRQRHVKGFRPCWADVSDAAGPQTGPAYSLLQPTVSKREVLVPLPQVAHASQNSRDHAARAGAPCKTPNPGCASSMFANDVDDVNWREIANTFTKCSQSGLQARLGMLGAVAEQTPPWQRSQAGGRTPEKLRLHCTRLHRTCTHAHRVGAPFRTYEHHARTHGGLPYLTHTRTRTHARPHARKRAHTQKLTQK